MKGSTNAELRKIITEDIGNLRAEFREDLGNIYGDVRLLDERFCADLRSLTDENKDILKKIDKIPEYFKVLNHDLRNVELKLMAITDMVNVHEKEIDKLQMIATPLKTNIPEEQKWIGFLCRFKDDYNEEWQCYDILEAVDYASTDGIFIDRIGNHWAKCELVKLTDKEVKSE